MATSDWTCSKNTTRPATGNSLLLSRRGFVSSFAAAGVGFAAGRGQVIPSEIRRFADAATELEIFRLTDPSHQSWLPAYTGRAVSKHGNFLIFASDISGGAQAYRMDLKSGQSRVLTDATHLEAGSLTLSPDERGVCFLDGGSLFLTNLSNLRPREIYRSPEGFGAGHGLSLSDDGLYAAFIEQKSGLNRLQLVTMRTGTAQTLLESAEPISDPMPRPRRAGLLYRRGAEEVWLVDFDGTGNRRLRLAQGGLANALWSTDGRSVLYLNVPSDRGQLNNLREHIPDTNDDRFISNTTQFATFNRNADSSVFVGASGSKASPYVLLLVRSVKRELTLCEHRASDPRLVSPIFSPNSQRVFFQSDRDGKMALYAMAVERLVEETESERPS
jgi:oligogalacturonide lyase